MIVILLKKTAVPTTDSFRWMTSPWDVYTANCHPGWQGYSAGGPECKRDQDKIRNYMDRRATPPRRDTSSTWGPPPPCKQALKCYDLCEAKLHYLRCAPNSLLCQTMFTLKIAAVLKSYFLWVCRGWQAALARDFCSPYFLWYFTFR